MPRPARRRSASSSPDGSASDGTVEQPVLLERHHQVLVGVEPRGRAPRLLGDDLRLQEGVVEDVLDDVLGHVAQQHVAVRALQLAGALREPEQDLEVDLVVGAVDAGRVVDEVGVDAARRGGRTRPARGA